MYIMKNKCILLFFLLLLIFISIFILNLLYPYFPDDWLYSYISGPQTILNTRVSSLSDVFYSQYNHYFLWGGRSVVHVIDQTLLMLDFRVMCLINSLVFVVFLYIIYLIANKKNNINIYLFLLLVFLTIIAQPEFCETVLWKTGTANYLYGTLIIILFIYQYIRYYFYPHNNYSKIRCLVIFIFGIVAGWTNENMSVALIFFILSFFFILKIQNVKIPYWGIYGVVGVVLGCVVMLIAPGNFVRLETMDNINGFFPSIETVLKFFSRYMIRLLIPYLLFLFLYQKYSVQKTKEERKKMMYISFLFVVTSIIALLVMSAAPLFPKRALFGIITLFAIGIGILYANIDLYRVNLIRKMNLTISIIFVVWLTVDFILKYENFYTLSMFWKERQIQAEKEKEKGVEDVVFEKPVPENLHKYFVFDLTEDPANWMNEAYAKYYGLKSVKVLNKEK